MVSTTLIRSKTKLYVSLKFSERVEVLTVLSFILPLAGFNFTFKILMPGHIICPASILTGENWRTLLTIILGSLTCLGFCSSHNISTLQDYFLNFFKYIYSIYTQSDLQTCTLLSIRTYPHASTDMPGSKNTIHWNPIREELVTMNKYSNKNNTCQENIFSKH